MNKITSILLLLLTLALVACDSDSDDNNLVIDDTPEVTLEALAGPDQSINEGEEVVLEGSGEASEENLSLSYSWDQIGGIAVELSGADSQVASFSTMVDADANLSFRLRVQSDTGLEATDEIVVSVNNAPTAVIEGTSSVVEGLGASLNGWQSTDSDGGSIVSYSLRQLSGNSAVLFYEDQATVSFAAPLVSGDENLSFELAVTDDDGAVDRATVAVEVINDAVSPGIASVSLAAGDYGIDSNMTISLAAAGAETGLALKAGSSFNGQELTDFAPVPEQDGNYTAIYTVAGSNPSHADGASVSANIVLVDPAGNDSAAITEILLDGVSIDTLPPELNSISVSEGDYGIGASVEIMLIAVNLETGLSLRAGSTFNGQELTDLAAVPEQEGYYTVIYTVASGDLDLAPTMEVNMSLVVLDSAGNESSEYATATLGTATSIDANAPVVGSIGVASGAYGIGDDVRISITAADGETDLTLSPEANIFNGGSLSQFDHIDSGVYSAIYTVAEGDPDIADNSIVDLNISLVDAHGNVGASALAVQLSNSSIDATRPLLSVVSISNGIYGIGRDMVIYLSEAADEVGLELLDSTFNGNSIAGFSDLQSGLYALTYTVAEGDTDQAEGSEVEANITLADSVGNASLSISSVSLSGESIDATAPIIESISVGEGAYLIGDELLVYISAIESDLRLRPGSNFNGQELSNFRALSNTQADYVATYTVVADDPDIDVGGTALSDIAVLDTADNSSIAITSVNIGDKTSIGAKSVNIDSIEVGIGAHRIGSDVVIRINTADGDPNLILKEGSSFNGQLLTDFTAVPADNGAYRVTYTVASGDLDIAAGGEVSVDITLVDTAGNQSDHYTSLTLSADTSIDANAPGISALTVAAGAYGIGDTIEIAISALNAETNLSLAVGSSFNDQRLTGFSAVDGQDGDYVVTYTVVEGDDDVADGSSVITSIALTDASGNPSTEIESVPLSGTSIDANRPVITSTAVASGVYGVGDDVVITLTTSANDTGLSLISNSFNGVTLGALVDNGDGTYTTTYTIGEGDTDIADGATVATDIAFVDGGGNIGDTIESLTLEGTAIDANSPGVDSIIITPGVYKVGDAVSFIIVASDDEAGLILSTSDTFNGSRLEGVSDNRDGNYSARYTVEEGDADVAVDGAVDVNISFTDAAGNDSPSLTSADLPAATSIDANSPGIDLISVAAGSYGVGAEVPVTISASNNESGLTLSSREFNGHNLTDIEDHLDGNYSAVYTVVEGDTDVAEGRTVAINLAFKDPSGNIGAAENSLSLSGANIDAHTPSVASVSAATGNYIVGSNIVITITAGALEGGLSLKSGSSFHDEELSDFMATSSEGVYTAIYTVAVENASLAPQDTVSANIALVDATGNESAAVTSVELGNTIVDTTVPSIYDVFVEGNNIINSNDDLTTIAIVGSIANVEDGEQIAIDIGGVGGGTLVNSADDLSGSFSTEMDLSSLGDGTHTVTIDVAEISGNTAQYIGSVLMDITPPTQIISDMELSHDTGAAANDFITNVSSQTISATLSAVLGSGDTLHGSVDSGATWSDITESGVSGRAIRWESVTLTSGSIMFKVTDVNGGDGEVIEQPYTLDTTAPTQGIGTIDIIADTGTSDNDFITNTAEQTITAELNASLQEGDFVHGSVDSGATWSDITASVTGTNISWDTNLTSGSIQFKVIDTAGNDGAVADQNYTIDTTGPTQTIGNIDISADTGLLPTDFITRVASQTITAELSAKLEDSDILYGSVDSGVTWIDITSGVSETAIAWQDVNLTSGAIQLKVVDLAGNDGDVAQQAYTLDTTAPVQEIHSLALSVDTGTHNDDFVTNTAEQTISASLSAQLNSDFILYGSVSADDDGPIWTNINDSIDPDDGQSINWSTNLSSGVIRFKVTDLAGNNGEITEQNYTLDTTVPDQTISAIALNPDNGTYDNDLITNTAEQNITAELAVGLNANDILYGSVALDQSGEPIWDDITGRVSSTTISWSTTISSGAIQFKVVDLAGNSGAVESAEYFLDTEPPTQVISDIKLSADNGPLNAESFSADFITNEDSQTITAELNATLGADDVLYGSVAADANGTTIWHNITSSVSGTLITWEDVTISSGAIQLKVVDLAGNDGDVAQQAYTLDEDKPTQSITSLALSVDSGTSATDFTTKEADQIISATLSAELGEGEALYASVDTGSTWQDITSTSVNGTAINWDTTLTSGSIMFKVIDTAGNEGGLTSRSYTLDTTAPVQTIGTIDISTDNGEFDTDFITSEPTQTITAELSASLETNDILYGSVASDDNGTIWHDITDSISADDNQSISWETNLVSGGAIQFKVVDLAGNNGDVADQNYTLDTTAPTQTINALALSTDSGSSSDDFVTNEPSQDITATLSAALAADEAIYASVEASADLLKIYDDANLTDEDSAEDGINFSWSTELANGANTLSFQVVDLAGNASGGTTQDYTLDTTAPEQSIDVLTLSTDSGSPGDFITNESSQTITAELNASLETGDTLHGSVASDENGPIWVDITTSISTDTNVITWSGAVLQIGTHELILRITDSADNNYTLEQQYTLDQTEPSIDTSGTDATVNEAHAATLKASDSTDDGSGIASYTWAQVENDGSDWADANTALTITNSDSAQASVTAPGIADDTDPDLTFYFAVTITDLAGNSATSSPLTLTVSNTHKTPTITATAGVAPGFDQISLSWTPTDGLTYDLHRSTDSTCDLISNCADYQLYAAVDLSSGAQIDSGLELFTPYYYWLEAELNGEVVSLSSAPLEANTTGPALNDTGITSGGDYPSGFDDNNDGVAGDGNGALCNGGYLDADNGNAFVEFTAEDCELGRDADDTLNDDSDGNAGFNFIRLNSDGSEYIGSGDYGTDPWSCVLDNVTGLIWEVKTTDGTWRDRNTGFTWYNPDHGQEFDKDGNPITFYGTEGSQDTQDFIDYVKGDSSVNNGSGLCGSTDWRLPTVHEIKGLADYDAVAANGLGGYSSPSIDTDYFPHALASQYNWYWTSHLNVDPDVNPGGDGTVAGSSTSNYYAWAYNSAESRTRSGTGSTVGSTVRSNYVRLVSSSAAVASHFSDYSDDRYTDNGDGTISDARTGLMWMQCSYGQTYDGGDTNSDGIICEGSPTFGSWQQAFAWAADSNANVDYGYNDWRLPNIKELGSIVDFGSAIPAINQSIFPNTSTGSYWTSTPSKALDVDSNDDNQSASIWFHTGDHGLNKRTANLYLRLVRDDVKTPRILTVNISDDNIIGSLDNFTDIYVSGTTDDVEADQKITLVINTTTVDAEIKEDGSFTTTIDLSGITDGTYSVTANVSDINEKPANQFTGSFLVDTVTPTIDSVSATAGIYGIGASVPLTITATDAETGLTLTSTTFNGQSLGAVTDNNDGTYTTTYTVIENDTDIADGGTVITDLAFTDPAGNAGEATTSVTLIGASIDAHRPTIASVGVATGTHGIGASVAITITAGSSETGLDLTGATFNGATLGSVNDKGDGTYNATYTVEEGNAHVADGGSVSVDLVFTDPAGNAGIAFESVTLPTGTSIDTTPPTQTISGIDISDDSGTLPDDFLTNNPTQTITATLSAGLEDGDTLHGSVDSGANWEDITNTSVSDTSINWATTLSSGSIQFKVVDAAGNDGNVSEQAYTLDQTNPSASISDITAAEGNIATLDSSASTDDGGSGIASHSWAQVSGGGIPIVDSTLTITNSDSDQASVIAPGIAEDDGDNLSFYFAVTITDKAGNSATSSPLTLTVSNTYQTPAITTSTGAPHFDQLSLSWQTATDFIYDLHRSSDLSCVLSDYTNCVHYALYEDADLSNGAQVDTDLEFFTPYYYWLQAQLNGEVVSLSSTPLEANTTGPQLNDTGVTQGGDYPSGFDTLSGTTTACNGGYLESNVGTDEDGNAISNDDNGDGDATDFIAFDDEDCELGRDATNNDSSDGHAGFSYTKLDSNGNALDASATEWSCVLDNVTGLIWEVKTTDGGTHDANTIYTWYSEVGVNIDDKTFHGTEGDGTTPNTQDLVDATNTEQLCGQSNWRLPSATEMVSLRNNSVVSDTFPTDSAYLPNFQVAYYWTSSVKHYANGDGDDNPDTYPIWNIGPTDLVSWSSNGTSSIPTRAILVSSSSTSADDYFNDWSDDRYDIHTDGTVTDKRTGLMWMRCGYDTWFSFYESANDTCVASNDGQYGGASYLGAFREEIKVANDVTHYNNIGGYTDWRLPNLTELFSLFDHTAGDADTGQALINPNAFPNAEPQFYRSSTPSANGDANYYINFAPTTVFAIGLGGIDTGYRIRLVRDDVPNPRILTLNINGDNVINADDFGDLTAIPVVGSTADVEGGQQIALAINATTTFYINVENDGSFDTTINLSGLNDGTYAVTANVSDAAGKAAKPFNLSLLKDIAVPTITSVSATSGTYKIDDSVPLTLTASESGLSLTSNTFNGQRLGAVTDNQDGTYTTSYTVVENDADIATGGTVATNLVFRDPAGNPGAATESITLTGASIDANRPTITSVDVAAGIHGIDDSVEITITAGANETDLELTSATFNGATLAAPTDNDDGTYTTTYTIAEGDPDVASGEDVSVDLAFTDPAGNYGTAFNTVTLDPGTSIDATAPTQTISTIKLSNDSGTLPDDFLTNNPTQTITATLSAALESGDTLHGSVDSGSTWDEITVSGTSITWNSVTLSSGSIQLKVVDAAGNDGEVAEQPYILDTTAPTINTSGTDSTVDEGSSASLNASASSDSNGIASHSWTQVQSDGSALTSTALDITNANSATASVIAPGIADDDGASLSLYFAVTVTDDAGNGVTSSPLTLTVTNTYTTPIITATAVGAPDFNQISLSWSADDDLTYSLYRSTDPNCVLSNYALCANPAAYADGTGITISGTNASVTDTSLEFFTPYYYWLGAQIGTEVVSLNSTPIEATNSGPTLNDTGITSGGDYPSGFDNHNGLADTADNAVCNGGYLVDDQGAVIADPSTYTGTTTFVAFIDEDCEVGRDASLNDESDGNAAFVFTKLDINGNTLSADATDWSCVLDHTTGLIWEVKTTDGTWRDVSKGFTWYNPNHGQDYDKDGNTITFDGTESSQDTQDFITYLNSDSSINNGSGLCGRSNWRLPTVHEIEGLADYDAVVAVVADDGSTSYSTPTIDTDYFPYALASQYQWYWTSHLNVDPDVNTGGGSSTSNYFAWTYGSAESRTRSGTDSTVGTTDRYNFVRLVSSSAAVASHFSDYSDDRYTDNGDGTISDAQTGLMWMQCSYGQTYDGGDTNADGLICEGSPTFGSWQQAFAWAADSTDYGYNDWRLPNIKELGSIVDFGSAKPAINQSIFPNTASGPYWSSTPSRANVHQAIFIGFQAGDYGPSLRTDNLYLRLVRDGVPPNPRIISLSINGDNIINGDDSSDLGAISVVGTTAYVEDDQKVSLNIGGILAEIAVNGNSFTTTINLLSLNDGTYPVTADVSDAAGQAANQFTSTLLKDTTSPSIPAVIVATDNIINSAEASAAPISGTTSGVEDGQTLSLAISDGTATVEKTVTVTSNAFSTSANLSGLADGTGLSLTADVADAAGNPASTLTFNGITKDTIPPTQAVEEDSIRLSTDSGTSSSDLITNQATQTISATLSDSLGTDYVLYASINGGTTSQQVDSSNISGTSISWSTTLLEGTKTIQFQVVDAVGNRGDLTEKDYTLDTTAPTQTISTIKLSDDTGVSNTDYLTNNPNQTINATLSATLEDGDTLRGSVDSGTNWSAVPNTDVSGTSINWDTTLTSGEIQFKVVDAAGNDGAVAKQAYTLDTTDPTINTSGTDSTADEGSSASLDASNSSDSSGIASYSWQQVASDGSAWGGDALSITNASVASTTVTTLGIAADTDPDLSLYFAVTVTDKAGNEASTTVTLTVTNTYKTPTITASTSDSFDQINLSWDVDTNLYYSLYRSTDPNCDLSNYNNACADPALYTDNTGITISGTTASITDDGLTANTIYYYWLEAQLDSEVVSLNTDPIQVATTPQPGIDAGRANSQAIGTLASLRGSATADPGKTIKSYLWQETTSHGISIDRADTASASFTVPDDLLVGDVLSFQLTAIDSDGARASATTSITIAKPGSQKWYFGVGDGYGVKSSPAIGADGTVYFGADDGNLYALNPQDGSIQWTFTTGAAIKTPPTIDANGTVYFASDDENLYAVSAPTDGSQSGVQEWSRSVGTIYSAHTSVSIAADGTLYYVGSETYFYALNPADGSELWKSDSSYGVPMTKPAISPSGTIYFAGGDNKIYAIDPSSGVGNSRDSLWEFATGSYLTDTSPAIGDDGSVYNGGWENDKLYALDSNGNEKWDYGPGGDVRTSPAIAADGTIYFGSRGKSLFALDSNADGDKKWRYQTGGNVDSSPVIGADGTVYVGSDDFNVYAFNPDNVTDPDNVAHKWSITTNGKVSFSSSALAPDGTLFIGSADGLYAIHTASAGLQAASPWPKFGQNNRNSGRVNLAPTANAGDDQTVSAGAIVTLDASASTDTDGNIIDYYWRETSSYGISITNNNSAQASFTAPNYGNDPITIELTVTDDHGATTTTTHTITIN